MSEHDESDLIDFGLTVLQARVYLGLLQLGTSKASQICSKVGIVRPETYRVLRELSAKGLVYRSLGSPSTFRPTPPAKALQLLLQQLKDRVVKLDEKKSDLSTSLTRLKSGLGDESDQRLSVITGGGNLNLKVRQMITDAREEYVGIVSKFGLTRLIEDGLADVMVRAKRRGLSVRVITEVDQSNRKSADYLSRFLEIRRSQDLLFYLDIVDRREMTFGPGFAISEEPISRSLNERELDLWTRNEKLVKGMYAMFEKLWHVCPKYIRDK